MSKPDKSSRKYPDFKPPADNYEITPREVLERFYGKLLGQEVSSAQQHAKTAKPVQQGAVRNIRFDKFLAPGMLDEKIPVRHEKSDYGTPARANHIQGTQEGLGRITMGEHFKYASKIDDSFKVNDTVIPSGPIYNEVLNHEVGHALFPASKGLMNRNATGIDYYDNPEEMVTELAHAQRQQFLNAGKRFDAKSFREFIKNMQKDDKGLQKFSPWTRNALRNVMDRDDEEIERISEVMPGLVGLLQQSNIA